MGRRKTKLFVITKSPLVSQTRPTEILNKIKVNWEKLYIQAVTHHTVKFDHVIA